MRDSAQIENRAWLIVIIFLLIVIPVLLTPYTEWFQEKAPVSGWSEIPLNYANATDYDIASFLKQNAGSNAYIISDIDSSLALEAITGYMGMWDRFAVSVNLTTVHLIYEFLSSETVNDSLHYLKMAFNSSNYEFYIVIDGRTSQSIMKYDSLQSKDFDSNTFTDLRVYYPVSTITSFPGLSKFIGCKTYELLMNSTYALVYRIDPMVVS